MECWKQVISLGCAKGRITKQGQMKAEKASAWSRSPTGSFTASGYRVFQSPPWLDWPLTTTALPFFMPLCPSQQTEANLMPLHSSSVNLSYFRTLAVVVIMQLACHSRLACWATATVHCRAVIGGQALMECLEIASKLRMATVHEKCLWICVLPAVGYAQWMSEERKERLSLKALSNGLWDVCIHVMQTHCLFKQQDILFQKIQTERQQSHPQE